MAGASTLARPTASSRRARNCPICLLEFCPTGGRQRCCSKPCARLYDWQTRQPKDRIPAPGGYVWKYVVNHPHGVRVNKKMRPEGGYIMEHRWVMEQQMGRYLLPEEKVHHKNGIRDDNDPSNLEVWLVLRKDPAGQRVEDLIDYLVAHYPERVAAALGLVTA